MGNFTQSVLNVPYETPIKLVEKGSITIQGGDTSTSATKIKDCDFTLKDNCLYYYVCRKSQMPTDGLYSNETFTAPYYSSGSATTLVASTTAIKTMYTNSSPSRTNSAVGIYTTVTNGKMSITKKYSSSATPNWSGIYSYNIYEIDLSKLGE